MTVSFENTPALLPAALAATDPILGKVRSAQEKIVTLNVDIGEAFGKAIAPAHVEPLDFIAFCAAYQEPLQRHCQAALGYVSGNAVQVMLRTANLAAAAQKIPTRAAVLKKSGKEKPLSDTAYLELLRDAQRKAGLTVAKPGSCGDRKSEAATEAKEATGKANPAAPAAVAAAAAKPVPAPQVAGKPAGADAAPAVPPTVDLKKVREDAATMLMGNAKNGDLLLQALTSRKAALIQWLQEKPKA
jgi:hypothetical protein